MASEFKSSDVGNSDMTNRSQKMFSVSKKVKVLDERKEKHVC
jgi:hypothetical protein